MSDWVTLKQVWPPEGSPGPAPMESFYLPESVPVMKIFISTASDEVDSRGGRPIPRCGSVGSRHTMPEETGRELLLGNLAIELGLITSQDLGAALEDQAQDGARFGFVRQLGTILVTQRCLTQQQLMDILREQSFRRARRLRQSAGS